MFTQTGIGSLEEKEIWKEGIWKAMVFFCLFNAFKIITFHTEHFRCFDAYILIVLYYDFELIVQWTENKVNTNRKKKKQNVPRVYIENMTECLQVTVVSVHVLIFIRLPNTS